MRLAIQRGKVVLFALTEERAGNLGGFHWILKQESFLPQEIFKNKDPHFREIGIMPPCRISDIY